MTEEMKNPDSEEACSPLTDEEFRARYDGLMEYAGVDPADSSAVFDTVSKKNAKTEEVLKRL